MPYFMSRPFRYDILKTGITQTVPIHGYILHLPHIQICVTHLCEPLWWGFNTGWSPFLSPVLIFFKLPQDPILQCMIWIWNTKYKSIYKLYIFFLIHNTNPSILKLVPGHVHVHDTCTTCMYCSIAQLYDVWNLFLITDHLSCWMNCWHNSTNTCSMHLLMRGQVLQGFVWLSLGISQLNEKNVHLSFELFNRDGPDVLIHYIGRIIAQIQWGICQYSLCGAHFGSCSVYHHNGENSFMVGVCP
jgi:hypothetical protein